MSCLIDDLAPTYLHALALAKNIIITGDLNCNLLTTSTESDALKDFMVTLNLSQTISSPTRITNKSESLIDILLTNNPDLVKRSDVLEISIRDHFLIYCILNLKVPRSKPQEITTRSYKNFNADNFNQDISTTPWDTVPMFDDVDDQTSCFNKLFLEALDRHAPIKTLKIKHNKTWVITTEIRDLMCQRDSMLKIARQTKNNHDWEMYRSLRRQVKSAIKKSESQLVRSEINDHKANKTSIWKTIRRCLNTKENSVHYYSKDCSKLANEFNIYFTSIGKNTAQQAKQLAVNHNLPPIVMSDDYRGQCEQFAFKPASQEDVKKTIMSMPSNKAPGYDKVPMRVIKSCLSSILPTITNIFNSSFSTGVFPNDWKQAEVVAHVKEGDHEIANNNRPISLLPVLSKVLERLAHNQIVDFLSSNNLMSVHQSGNKKNHSTETLGILFTNHILEAMDNGKLTAVMMLDLSKAFDSIDHHNLLEKLKRLNFSQPALSWLQSYLTNRTQRVRINSALSDPLPIEHGVP